MKSVYRYGVTKQKIVKMKKERKRVMILSLHG